MAGGEVGKLREELVEVKAEKSTLEKKLVGVQADLAKAKEDLEEVKDEITVYEELVTSFTKKDEADLQEFADMVSEWKGKAKAFDQAKVAMEKTKQIEKENVDLKAKLESMQQGKGAPAPAAAAVAATGGDKELQSKYEQAKKNLENANTRITQLEQTIKNKDGEIADLKSRLMKANAAASSGVVATGGEEDPLIEMVEKLLKDMEDMAKESEEYLAQVEKEFPSLGGKHQSEEEEESEEEEVKPVKQEAPKPAAAAAPQTKPAAPAPAAGAGAKVPPAAPAPAPSATQSKPPVMKK